MADIEVYTSSAAIAKTCGRDIGAELEVPGQDGNGEGVVVAGSVRSVSATEDGRFAIVVRTADPAPE